MKPASKFVLATAAFTVTGVALACTVLPMLPFSISVDLKDIAARKPVPHPQMRPTGHS